MSSYSALTQVLSPYAAKINGLLTGYDGTKYSTPGEAVRTQINDLHVLIGDEPGTAISASAIGYGEESVEDALDGLNERLTELEGGGTGGLTADVKAALLACFENVAWANANGPSSYSALEAALNPPSTLTSISAVYTQSGVVYDSDSLDTLKANLAVTAHYSDNTSEVVSGYALSGTLTEGTSTITVTYGGKTTTFTVNVTTVWSYDIDDLTPATGAMVGAASANAGVALAISTTNRRSFFVDDGPVSVAIQQANQITSQTSEYYPVKVPEGATGVTVSVTPSTQYVAVYLYELTNGKYTSVTASGDSGYTVGSHSKTWTAAPDNYYILITTKYDNAGSSYPVEPTGLDIAFVR